MSPALLTRGFHAPLSHCGCRCSLLHASPWTEGASSEDPPLILGDWSCWCLAGPPQPWKRDPDGQLLELDVPWQPAADLRGTGSSRRWQVLQET